ncbi:MAG: LemA family protein [Clostridia bacterium]|nr:LemA family protein [Clostridia bacterium]
MKKGLIAIITVLIIVAIIAGVGISNYNGLVTAREEVASAESNIDTYLQRRADLIPNVVATVKSYAAHESEVYSSIAAARQKLVNASTVGEKAEANEELTAALQGLNVVVESYPELKADTTYVALMDELEGSENRIATARKDYNDTVKEYNNKVIRFPGNIFAGIFGFEKAEYFEAAQGADKAPDVGTLLGD